MFDSTVVFWLYTATVLLFAFFNGFNNSGALIAAPIASRSVEPGAALAVALAGEVAGPFLFGVAVATTLGQDLLLRSAITLPVLLAAILAAMSWNIVTWFIGFPSSSANALIGGMLGAAIVAQGWGAVLPGGLVRVLASLLLSPLLGLAGGFLFIRLLHLAVQSAAPSVNQVFRLSQLGTTVALALSHGTNDGQKSMGLIALGLLVLQPQSGFDVPLWVTAVCALALALGVSAGGFRLIHTLGGRIYRMRPIHGFASQGAAAAIVLGAALLGGPVSTMQVVGSSIMGVGSGVRLSAVRWGLASQIVMAWLVTVPTVALGSGALYLILRALVAP